MRIGVFPHIQPILPTIDADGSIQISALKLAIEDDILSTVVSILPYCFNVVDEI
jgi:hypothetical protein